MITLVHFDREPIQFIHVSLKIRCKYDPWTALKNHLRAMDVAYDLSPPQVPSGVLEKSLQLPFTLKIKNIKTDLVAPIP